MQGEARCKPDLNPSEQAHLRAGREGASMDR
jgi:hypothetical protein